MKHKDWARSPPTTRNIPELGISDSIPLTEYFPFRARTPFQIAERFYVLEPFENYFEFIDMKSARRTR